MTLRIHLLFGWVFLIGIACLTGCKTTDQAGSGHMASVTISGHTKNEIQTVVMRAFLANGYFKIDGLTYEKKGSAWDTANYGGWSGDSVWIKIRAVIIFAGSNRYTLGCDAYVVAGRGDVGTETEQKFLFAKRTECKKILDEAKAALDALTSATGAANPQSP